LGKKIQRWQNVFLEGFFGHLEFKDGPSIPARLAADRYQGFQRQPAESAKIANSLALNYCIGFTKQRGISAEMLTTARVPAKALYGPLIFKIPKVIIRSVILALLIAFIGWGIAIIRGKISRMPPPLPVGESAPRRFQKY
jgi:hypothetical protein